MSPELQLERMLRYADHVAPREELVEKVERGRPLRVKLGLDPTAPAVTLGWAVVLRKLRQFQELGHTAILIVGDFTARVGDPSERGETRRRLSAEEVNGYAENVLRQFEKILLPEPLEIRRNSEWLADMDMAQLLELTSAATVAQMLERQDFAKRYSSGEPISVMEFLYPLLQGFDSVAVEADIELGGSDQLWNLMMGRTVQERYGMAPQVALTMPLLVGTDGSKKMSQSLRNYIGVEDEPAEMFGKTMSLPDESMEHWFQLAADFDPDRVEQIMSDMASGRMHPNEIKRLLARSVVAVYHGESAGRRAEAEFDQVFKHGGVPDDIEDFSLPDGDPVNLVNLVRDAFAVSGSEARRLIQQGGVRLDGETLADSELARAQLAGRVLQVGKRKFVSLID
ncbi:MAG: tyrosine--tRNA ligase [Acidimicrobiia bacterium]|nr:tyrosine--tRNA ligase [Acidimicrobiia bacterium]